MFDFLSYVRDSGFEVKILPPKEGILIALDAAGIRAGNGLREEVIATVREGYAANGILVP